MMSAQKFTVLDSRFTIIDKNDSGKKNNLIMGHILYDSKTGAADFDIKFPEKENWELRDSFLTKFRNDTISSVMNVGKMSESFMFKSILEFRSSDFGLAEAGFQVLNVEEGDEGVLNITWDPPSIAKKFLKTAYTSIHDNLLQSVIFEDVDGKKINETFYEKYEVIQGIPVPVQISSIYRGQEEIKYRIIKLKDVELQ